MIRCLSIVLAIVVGIALGCDYNREPDPAPICETFLRPPTCSEAGGYWTCCDHLHCFTFRTEPDCQASDVVVCCG